MFTVMFQGMLRGFKHIKRIYRNTDIGNAAGRSRHIPKNTLACDCNMTPHKQNKTNKEFCVSTCCFYSIKLHGRKDCFTYRFTGFPSFSFIEI